MDRLGRALCRVLRRRPPARVHHDAPTSTTDLGASDPPRPESVAYFSYTGRRIRAIPCHVYDGDTFSILFEDRQEWIKYRCRCLGYDSPEMKPLLSHPHRLAEKESAAKAKARFQELLSRSPDGWVTVECGGFDKYGRILVTVFNGADDPRSLNDIMLKEGHGVPYYGGKKITWSDAPPPPADA